MEQQDNRLNTYKSIEYGVFVDPINGQPPNFNEDFQPVDSDPDRCQSTISTNRLVIDLRISWTPHLRIQRFRVYFTQMTEIKSDISN